MNQRHIIHTINFISLVACIFVLILFPEYLKPAASVLCVSGILVFLRFFRERYYHPDSNESELLLADSKFPLSGVQQLLSTNPTGIFICDAKGRLIYGNQVIAEIFELAEHELTSIRLAQLFGDTNQELFNEIKESVFNNSRWEGEGNFSKDVTSLKWLQIRAVSIMDGEFAVFNIHDVSNHKRLRISLERSYHEQAAILEQAGIALIITLDGIIKRVNNQTTHLLQQQADELVNKSMKSIIRQKNDDWFDKAFSLIEKEQKFHGEQWFENSKGKRFWGTVFANRIYTNRGRSAVAWLFIDETRQRRSAESLRKAAVVFEASSESILILNKDKTIKMVNTAFTKTTGYSFNEVQSKSPQIYNAQNNSRELFQEIWQSIDDQDVWTGELSSKKRSGELFNEWASITAVRNEHGQVVEFVMICSDITHRKEAENKIVYQANYDELTGLPNRTLFLDRLKQSIMRCKRESAMLALLIIDLDRFKNINDSLGHSIGDQLLKRVSEILESSLRKTDTLARLGGDEFAVVLAPIFGPRNASRVAQNLITKLSEPIRLSSYEVTIGASIGVALYPNDATFPEDLVKGADSAVYKAKEKGRNNYQFYTEDMQLAALRRLSMERDLRSALENEQFELHFQPQVDAKTELVVGVETLIRWNHPNKGWIAPIEFIPLAEDTGLIIPIGDWVLAQACLQIKSWQQQGIAPKSIAINVSGRQFLASDFVKKVEKIVFDTGVNADSVELELTESMLVDDVELALQTLNKLKFMGIKLSVDDFGTGYSSLSYLKQFPLHTVKIDQSFVRDINTDEDDRAIVDAIIQMGHALGLYIIAEGVEEQEHVKYLTDVGCDALQGYYFSRPMSAEDTTLYLKEKINQASK
jgi:diguanylate cyclase (GGDEF)-like protein/PAS domain S-box-containing protein